VSEKDNLKKMKRNIIEKSIFFLIKNDKYKFVILLNILENNFKIQII
jgi:signal transduction histidine kinase